MSDQSRTISGAAGRRSTGVMAPRAAMGQALLSFAAAMRRVEIQDAAPALGVTSRTLRHYEDKGLVRSHRSVNNVRSYDAAALERLQAIIELRALGLSLAAIAGFLTLGDTPEAQAKAVHAALSGALARQQARLARLTFLLQAMGEGEPTLPVAIAGLGRARRGPP